MKSKLSWSQKSKFLPLQNKYLSLNFDTKKGNQMKIYQGL